MKTITPEWNTLHSAALAALSETPTEWPALRDATGLDLVAFRDLSEWGFAIKEQVQVFQNGRPAGFKTYFFIA